MRHRLLLPRQEAIRWLGRAFGVIGLLAVLALPFGGAGGAAPFHHPVVGIGEIAKALPAEHRQGRPAAVSPDRVPDGAGSIAAAVPVDSPPERPAVLLAARDPGWGVAPRVPFLRPTAQAPPAPI